MRRRPIVLVGVALVTAALLVPAAAAGTSTRLVIQKLHLDVQVGTSLDNGPMYYPGSAHPGEPYTIAIAGHRTTHTHPFWALDELRRGDTITLVYKGARHTYRVTSTRVVAPTDWRVTRDRGYERLILSTCTPRFTARDRLVVIALPNRGTSR
jgi:sortase A